MIPTFLLERPPLPGRPARSTTAKNISPAAVAQPQLTIAGKRTLHTRQSSPQPPPLSVVNITPLAITTKPTRSTLTPLGVPTPTTAPPITPLTPSVPPAGASLPPLARQPTKMMSPPSPKPTATTMQAKATIQLVNPSFRPPSILSVPAMSSSQQLKRTNSRTLPPALTTSPAHSTTPQTVPTSSRFSAPASKPAQLLRHIITSPSAASPANPHPNSRPATPVKSPQNSPKKNRKKSPKIAQHSV